MVNLKIYCCTIKYFKVLEKLPSYITPVGLGHNDFPHYWIRENSGENIIDLNPYYAEFTMFYWIWKNKLKEMQENDFVGTCQHRLLWLNKHFNKKQKFNFTSLYSNLLKSDNEIFLKNDLIHLNEISFKNKNLYNDFCEVHNKNFLDNAISLLPKNEEIGFKKYLDNKKIYPMNMFITKVKFFEEYCSFIFPWLEKCFKYGKENNLYIGYNKRLVAFLMERFTSYWFDRFTEKSSLSYARLGSFHLSNKINSFVSTINLPLTFWQYPTISRY
jgi:hypothetical protein